MEQTRNDSLYLENITADNRIERIRYKKFGAPVIGGVPDIVGGANPTSNDGLFDIGCTLLYLENYIKSLDKHIVYFGYDPTQQYKPFDKVIIENGLLQRDIYQVYNPQGCIGIDPQDAKNRPSGWQETDPTKPVHWIKLPPTGERGRIGAIVIAMSHEREENMIPFVGGTFEINSGYAPWLWQAIKGYAAPSNEKLQYGMRENDFMRFISSKNSRLLLSPQSHAMQRIYGAINNFMSKNYPDLTGSFFKAYEKVNDYGGTTSYIAETHVGFDSSRVASTDIETRPVNTALTAFITI